MSDEEKARAEQAARLREEIEQLRGGRRRAPRSPHEFVEEQMSKRAAEAAKKRQEAGEDSPSDSPG